MLTPQSQLLLSQARRGQILEHAEQSEEALKIWLPTLEEAKSVVHDCREQLKTEIDRLCVTEEAMGKSDELEAATVIRTGPHRQRLRAGMHNLPKFVHLFRLLTEDTPGDVTLILVHTQLSRLSICVLSSLLTLITK